MSDAGFLERLLDGASVEWKPLGELTIIKTGQSVSKNKIASNPGKYPVINSGKESLGFINEWNTVDDPIGVTTRGAGVGSVTWQEGKYYRGNLNYSVSIKPKVKLNVKFLYHLLLEMQPDLHALCTFVGIPALNAGNLKTLPIPIPCPNDPKKSLAIQAEIVRILDAFTELTAELTARKKQYNHYRDKLLSFEDGDGGDVEWKALGKVTSPTRNIRWRDACRAYRYIDLTSVSIDTKSIIETSEVTSENAPSRAQKLVEKDDVIFATTRPTQQRYCLIDEMHSGEVVSTGYCVLRANDKEGLSLQIVCLGV